MAKHTESDHAKITAVTEIGVETGSEEAILVQAANRNKPEKMSWLQDQGFGMFSATSPVARKHGLALPLNGMDANESRSSVAGGRRQGRAIFPMTP